MWRDLAEAIEADAEMAMSDQLRDYMRKIFFSGATAMYEIVRDVVELSPEGFIEYIGRMGALKNELYAFAESMGVDFDERAFIEMADRRGSG